MSKKLITGLCRLSYAHLFQPHADLNGKEKYSASLIIPKSDKATLGRYQQAIDEMLKDPDVKRTLGNGGGYRKPLRDGDADRPEDPAYQNCYFINASSNTDHKPAVYSIEGLEVVDPNEVYSGCWVQAILFFYAYNKGGNRGIGCSLNAVRKRKDDTPLSGNIVSASDFDSVPGMDADSFF